MHHRSHGALEAGYLERILLVTFDSDAAGSEHGEQAAEACRIALQNFELGEVVLAPAREFAVEQEAQDAWRGELPVDLLVAARRRYGITTVLLGRVNLVREYGKPAIGLELRLYDAMRGRLLWMADDVLDAQLPEVRAALASFRFEEGLGDRAFEEDASLVPWSSFHRFAALSFTAPLARDHAPRIVAANPEDTPAER